MGKRAANKEAKRQAIEDAARRLFIADGFDRCSVERIVAEAEIARGTFYLYYPDKLSLFEAMAARLYGPLVQSLERSALALAEARTVEEQRALYVEMAVDIVATVQPQRPLVMLHFREAWSAGPAGQVMKEWRQRLEAQTQRIVEDAIARQLLRPVDVFAVSAAIVGACERLVWAWMQDEQGLDRARLAGIISELFWKGLRPEPE